MGEIRDRLRLGILLLCTYGVLGDPPLGMEVVWEFQEFQEFISKTKRNKRQKTFDVMHSFLFRT